MVLEIKLTEDQIREELGKIILYKFQYRDMLGIYYKKILANNYTDAIRKLKEICNVTQEPKLIEVDPYIIF